jgi:competence protein ComEC
MAVAQIAGMAVVPVALVSRRLAALCGLVAHIGAAGLVWSADLVRFAPVVTYRVAAPSWWAVGVYYSGAMVTWILWTRARHARLAAAGLAIASAIWILDEPRTWRVAHGDGRLHVTFIDVGQGDSMVLRFPRGSTILVDAGGLTFGSGFDVGDRVVSRAARVRHPAAGRHRPHARRPRSRRRASSRAAGVPPRGLGGFSPTLCALSALRVGRAVGSRWLNM